MDDAHLYGTSFDVDDQRYPATAEFDDTNVVTEHSDSVAEHDAVVENDAHDQADPSATNEETKGRAPRTEEEMRECKYCNFKADDWPEFAKHVFKSHHIKKVAEAYNIKLTKESSTFSCDICFITCCGHQSLNAHLLGAKHHKALQLRAAENEQSAGGGPMKNSPFGNTHNKKPYDKLQKTTKSKSIGAKVFASYPQPLIGLEYVTEVQVAGQNPRYECFLCDAKFEHDLKFPHLVGQKHRMNVLKLKRPDFVKELHPTSKKRSELSAALLKESIDLELAEGRKEVKIRVEKLPPLVQPSKGRGGSRGGGRSAKRNTGQPQRGSWNKRGTSFSRGRGSVPEFFNNPPLGGPSGLSYASFGGDGGNRYNSFNYERPYNAGYDIPNRVPNYGSSYQQSTSGFQQGYHESNPSYFDSGYSAPPPQIEPGRNFDVPSKKSISTGLASALGDLTKLVKNDEDASVALQVSNALTQALLQYRMDDIKDDYN